jgi:predicted nucleic acid-binding protein
MAQSNPADLGSIQLIICDAGPLIHLDELDCIDLLSDFDAVLIPNQVWQEVQNHRPTALTHDMLKLQRVTVSIDTSAAFQSLVHRLTLDLGEQAALSLMAKHTDAILLTDDAAARVAAQALNYRAYGTLGILLRSIRRNQKSSAAVVHILETLPQNPLCTFVMPFCKALLPKYKALISTAYIRSRFPSPTTALLCIDCLTQPLDIPNGKEPANGRVAGIFVAVTFHGRHMIGA